MTPTRPALVFSLALVAASAVAGCAQDEPRSRYTGGGMFNQNGGGSGGGFVGDRAGDNDPSASLIEAALGELLIAGTFNDAVVDGIAGVDHTFDGSCTNLSGAVDVGVGVGVSAYLHLMPPLTELPDDAVLQHDEGDTTGTFVIVSDADNPTGFMATSATITVSRTASGQRWVHFTATGNGIDIVAETLIGGDE